MNEDNPIHREIAAQAGPGDHSGIGRAPNGAAPELLGFAAVAVVLMALLTIGYRVRSPVETAQATAPVSAATTGMAQPAGSADQPKVYQPVNPAPDTRAAPTSSSTGVGPDNGSTGQTK